jgi:hypothetical protein
VILHAQGVATISCVHETTCRGDSKVLAPEFRDKPIMLCLPLQQCRLGHATKSDKSSERLHGLLTDLCRNLDSISVFIVTISLCSMCEEITTNKDRNAPTARRTRIDKLL